MDTTVLSSSYDEHRWNKQVTQHDRAELRDPLMDCPSIRPSIDHQFKFLEIYILINFTTILHLFTSNLNKEIHIKPKKCGFRHQFFETYDTIL